MGDQHPGSKNAHTITLVNTPTDLNDATTLFHEYAASLGIDLTFQDFATEISTMPGKYASPTGFLLLARSSAGQALGCVGLRSLDGLETCEMKRLYVSPPGRGTGLGKKLAVRTLDEARRLGYRHVRLDTLGSMASALALYEKLGFSEVEAYYNTPLEGTVFLGKSLG